MNRLKKIIILLIAILLILIIVLIRVLVKNKTKEEDNLSNIKADEKLINKVESYTKYYTVTNIIASYYGKIGEKDEEAIYNILYKEYANKKSVEEEMEKVNSTDPIFYVRDMYVQTDGNLYIYYVCGRLKDYLDSEESQKVYLKVYIDDNTLAYSILPINEETYKNAISKKEISNLCEIESNDYNKFSYMQVSNTTQATLIFNNYKQLINEDVEESYNMLDEEYKEKKFRDINEYKNYIKNNSSLKYATISKFSTTVNSQYTQYTCLDQYGNYYIFQEESVMNYKVLLDNYTIDSTQFIEKYDSTNEKGKCTLNIEKIKQALNSGDYKYVYGKLAESFKNNKYKTQEEFENYMKQAIYNNIIIEYGEFSNEGSTYIYDIKIKDANNAENQIINMQIIMQLKEDRDFVMSFSIK